MQTNSNNSGQGNGTVGVLLVHGLRGSPSEVRYISNGLLRAGYKVAVPELAGHCGTDEDLKASTWQDWYASAEKALLELYAECDTVIVGGLSTGAVLAMLLAARHPDKVHATTLYSPTLWLSGSRIPWYMPVLVNCINMRWLADFFTVPFPSHVGIKDKRIRDFVRNALGGGAAEISTPGIAVLERRRLCDVVRRHISSLKQPTLIMHSREDDFAGLDNATYLERALPGPVDLVILDDCYHMVTVDRQRHVVLERTLEFIARATATARPAVVRTPARARTVVPQFASVPEFAAAAA